MNFAARRSFPPRSLRWVPVSFVDGGGKARGIRGSEAHGQLGGEAYVVMSGEACVSFPQAASRGPARGVAFSATRA